MLRRPLIGLPGRRRAVGDINGFPASLGELHLDLYFADYARGVYHAGGMPVHLPLDADPVDWVHHVDGLVLTGGADIDPARYGHPNTGSQIEPERDHVEFVLYETALADGIPVLGICRGFQLINVHHGGTLHQSVPEHSRYDIPPGEPSHDVEIVEDSMLYGLFGATHRVNSLHHQTADEIGEGLVVTARADDGVAEGFETADGEVLAVQWHPEMMTVDDPTFSWVVDASRRRAVRS
jgi:putative glutamine amidotransferase